MPTGPRDEHQWFTASIGPVGERGTELFQVAVATPSGIRGRRRKGQFIGLVVDRFEPARVEKAIREYVEATEAPSWELLAEKLGRVMRWEYRDYRA